MSLKAQSIQHKKFAPTLVASTRFNLKKREEMRAVLDELTQAIPSAHIAGPAFCIFQFISSVSEGFDVKVGFPVSQAVQTDAVKTRTLPAMEVLALVHQGPVENLRESYGKLYSYAAEHGLISDEFSREIYLDANDPTGNETELHFVLHDWNELLGKNLERVLGQKARRKVMQGEEKITLEASVDERFCWVKGVIERLDRLADTGQKYDILSSCAHVFPKGQIAKLQAVFESARAETNDPLQAADAVLEFMAQDPGWIEGAFREGHVIYAAKSPRDPQGHKDAQTEAERKKAYCFCPIVRNHLDQGMPVTYCYCGSGWYRQQWEGAIGKPVQIEIVQSILKGDEVCQFAVHLPDDL
jgi:effector-binding domain-containing protein